jgi:hypothetical protein
MQYKPEFGGSVLLASGSMVQAQELHCKEPLSLQKIGTKVKMHRHYCIARLTAGPK